MQASHPKVKKGDVVTVKTADGSAVRVKVHTVHRDGSVTVTNPDHSCPLLRTADYSQEREE